jgi:predicted TIM-barrel fold metal-dependent hydrolase
MTVRRFDEVRPGGWEPGPRVEDQDIDGVEAEVLFGPAVGAPLPSGDPLLTRAGYTAYNNWLADFCSYAPKRLIGMAYVPCNDPDDAIAAARDAAARGLRGAVLPHQPPGGGDWAAEEWAPLWRTIVELGWPAHLHVGGSANIGSVSSGRGAFINGLVASKFNMPLSLGALVFSGVLAEHPDLKLICVEGQIGWIPFWKYYIDHVYEKHRWHQNVHLPELPSTYIERQMWFTFMEDPPGIEARHACGVDRIMWSSDYPHSETTWPHSQKIIGDIFERIPADEVKKIVRDNCVKLYGIG